jgi:hypothetical protein
MPARWEAAPNSRVIAEGLRHSSVCRECDGYMIWFKKSANIAENRRRPIFENPPIRSTNLGRKSDEKPESISCSRCFAA